MNAPANPMSATEWSAWLSQWDEKSRQVFTVSPERLISEFRREREITLGYHGREVLELLQNAGDATQDASRKGRVKIVLRPHGMAVANIGEPFNAGGVESLLMANFSPKRMLRKAAIGDKGLGFRSIFNWTDSPLINSGNLRLAFLPVYARAVLGDLESNSPKLAELLSKELEYTTDLIIPRLAFPTWMEDWAVWPASETGAVRSTAAECQRLRDEGFVTVIGMPFTGDKAHEEARRQLQELRPEILLFVDSIEHLEIDAGADSELQCWQRDISGDRWTILENDCPRGSWTMTTNEATVPLDKGDPDQKEEAMFRVTVAVPHQPDTKGNGLYCFFPTEVEWPLPVVCHATLRLDETRKHVNDTPANRYILAKLAEEVANAAEQNAALRDGDPWLGCHMLVVAGLGSWPAELQRLGFADAIKKHRATRAIVPALDLSPRKPSEAKLPSGKTAKWLPARHFCQCAAIETSEHRAIAKELGLAVLGPAEVQAKLLAVDDLTLAERAMAIAGLLEMQPTLVNGYSSGLLCDEEGAPLPMESQPMFHPTGPVPPVPPWVRLRFLNTKLRTLLATHLKAADNRDLQVKLRSFGLVEYSVAALISPVVADTNREIQANPAQEEMLRHDLLGFLFKLHRTLVLDNSDSAFPSKVTVKLPAQNGGFQSADELYFGTGFGPEGATMQDLYGSWAPERVLAPPERLALEGPIGNVMVFLRWLGVEQWPREVKTSNTPSEFLTFAVASLRYPAQFEENFYESSSQLPYPRVSDVVSLDGLQRLLTSTPPEAIIAWLGRDARAAGWSYPSPTWGTLGVWPDGVRRYRECQGELPSFIHWQIANTPWLPASDRSGDHLAAPCHCMFGERSIEALFPAPSLNRKRLELYAAEEFAASGLHRAGVMLGLGQLRRDEVYRLLLEVPEHFPDGKESKALCRWFLQHEAELYGSGIEYRTRFFKEGKLWATRGDFIGYVPITDLQHVDSEGLPEGLLRQLAIVDLPKRAGSDKVERLFNVRALERSGISQKLQTHQPLDSFHWYENWFEEAKPYLLRLRHSQTTQAQQLTRLERLQLCVCAELIVTIQHEAKGFVHEGKDWEWFIFDDILYVRAEIVEHGIIDLVADAVGTAIASLFRLGDGDSFAKMLLCDALARHRLLKKMGGDDFDDEIHSAALSRSILKPYSGPVVELEKKILNAATAAPEDLSNLYVSLEEDAEFLAEEESPREPGIRELTHIPTPPADRRSLVVRTAERQPGIAAAAGNHRPGVNGDQYEAIAMQFEERADPRRFSLRVGNVTGTDALGCDVLSFATGADREHFKQTGALEKVVRFIEVKGRSAVNAKIELIGNELRAACRYRDRYFIYRLHQPIIGHYHISILANPLAEPHALTEAYHVDLDSASGTRRFDFVPENLGDFREACEPEAEI